MAIQTMWGTQGVVYVDGERVGVTGPPSWSQDVEEEIVNGMVQYHPAPKSLEISVDFDFKPVGDYDDIRQAFGIETHPTTTLVYKPRRWFQPTLTLKDATIQQMQQHEEEGMVVVSFDVHSQGYDVEWPNRWARPVYWLWRQWLTDKGLGRKFRGIGTER